MVVAKCRIVLTFSLIKHRHSRDITSFLLVVLLVPRSFHCPRESLCQMFEEGIRIVSELRSPKPPVASIAKGMSYPSCLRTGQALFALATACIAGTGEVEVATADRTLQEEDDDNTICKDENGNSGFTIILAVS
eukprot:gb/GECG01010238.1/.p1 GENE.gb/GECG01010238.1/~~gb/GECG01010238.1/.p1  ORF type:complete len:134 (+),score=9.26 gb/GECG01010238.1/:1-402(+)